MGEKGYTLSLYKPTTQQMSRLVTTPVVYMYTLLGLITVKRRDKYAFVVARSS